MTGNRYLLDTNIVSAWLKDDITIAEKIERALQVFIPIIVIGEMYYGAQYSARVEHNIRNISKVLAYYSVLLIDETCCNYYGSLKASLRKKGKPIPENDIWIAAIALQYNLTLATRDGHFNEVENLPIENW